MPEKYFLTKNIKYLSIVINTHYDHQKGKKEDQKIVKNINVLTMFQYFL